MIEWAKKGKYIVHHLPTSINCFFSFKNNIGNSSFTGRKSEFEVTVQAVSKPIRHHDFKTRKSRISSCEQLIFSWLNEIIFHSPIIISTNFDCQLQRATVSLHNSSDSTCRKNLKDAVTNDVVAKNWQRAEILHRIVIFYLVSNIKYNILVK